jgi:fatty acid desaturase
VTERTAPSEQHRRATRAARNAPDPIRATVSAEGLTALTPRASAWHLSCSWGGYVGLAAVGLTVDHPAAWIACWFLMAWLLVGNGGVMHETAHGHLFPGQVADRAVGMVAAATVLLPWATYRAFHLEHHINTAGPDDPEGEPIRFTSKLQYALLIPLAGTVFSAQLAWFTLRTVAGRPPKWVRTASQRRLIRINALVMVATTALLVWGLLTYAALIAKVWLVPLAFLYVVLFPFVLLSEHYGGQPDLPALENTRTVRSNPAVRWAFWNNNFHAEHHLVPTVPYTNLPRLHQLTADQLGPEWLAPSYTSFHRGVLAALPLIPRRRPPSGSASGTGRETVVDSGP